MRPGATRWAAAGMAALAAFALYWMTLLPGFDFGDTGYFQATVGSPLISPRDGYPLYFAVGSLFARMTPGNPAFGLNLASAVEGALACGVIALVATELGGSLLAGVGAALLFASSYTFWSQSTIAEVYAFHILFVSTTVWLLLRWEAEPTLRRLALFFLVYALGFGNHLSMILLAPGFTLFLLTSGGWRSMLRPRVIALAVGCAVAGALPYSWNLRTLWMGSFPPHDLVDALGRSWFDITKSDWRETLVAGVAPTMLSDRLRMYTFDVRQQFGVVGCVAALLGLVRLSSQHPLRAALISALYAVNFLFAFAYNVGDVHVFYLPPHLMAALLAAPGFVAVASVLGRLLRRRFAPSAVARLATAMLIVYSGARAYRDYPALDRHTDRRPQEVLSALTAGIDDRHTILLTALNWQVVNGLSYFTKHVRPEVATAALSDVVLYAPALIRDNVSVGRSVALTARARDTMVNAYGPFVPIVPDPDAVQSSILARVRVLAPRTRYALSVLKPTREFTLDRVDVSAAIDALSGRRMDALPQGDYFIMAGIVGQPPVLLKAADQPFSRRVDLQGVAVDIRMESWLAADTIRRMGFGHVIAARRHALIIERGVSFVGINEEGRAVETAYAANIFTLQPRYLCYR